MPPISERGGHESALGDGVDPTIWHARAFLSSFLCRNVSLCDLPTFLYFRFSLLDWLPRAIPLWAAESTLWTLWVREKLKVGGLTWMGAQEVTPSQRKRRKQEESEYAPALAVTDIVTECDKARERQWWNWIIPLQGPRPTLTPPITNNCWKQITKKKHITVFLSEREKRSEYERLWFFWGSTGPVQTDHQDELFLKVSNSNSSEECLKFSKYHNY